MRHRREAKTPHRPRVITRRLLIVSLVIGVVLAVGSVPVGVALDRVPLITSVGNTTSKSVLYGELLIDMWSDSAPTLDKRRLSQSGGWAEPARSHMLEIGAAVDIDHDPRPGRARAWLQRHGDQVFVFAIGWPFRAAEGQLQTSTGGIRTREIGLLHFRAFGGYWTLPYLPLWPGLLGNTLFYAILIFAPIAVLRRRTLRRRARRGLCLACAYELGEGVEACPECGLARVV